MSRGLGETSEITKYTFSCLLCLRSTSQGPRPPRTSFVIRGNLFHVTACLDQFIRFGLTTISGESPITKGHTVSHLTSFMSGYPHSSTLSSSISYLISYPVHSELG